MLISESFAFTCLENGVTTGIHNLAWFIKESVGGIRCS